MPQNWHCHRVMAPAMGNQAMHPETETEVLLIAKRDELKARLAIISDCVPYAGYVEKLHLLNMRRKVARQVHHAQIEIAARLAN